MSDDRDQDEIIGLADAGRRDFVRRIVQSGVFAVPVVATYTVSGVLLDSGEAEAQSFFFS